MECFINNKWDWPGKNWSMWKSKTVIPGNEYYDGRWRFCLYDTEFGGISGTADCATNTIKEDNYKKYGLLDMDTDNPAVLCFAYLMTNADFRQEFYAKLEELDTGVLTYANATERLAFFENTYGSLLTQFFERYPDTGSKNEALSNPYYASATCISNFLVDRTNHIQKMIDYCEETEAELGF